MSHRLAHLCGVVVWAGLGLAHAMTLSGGIQHTETPAHQPPKPGRVGLELEITPQNFPLVVAVPYGLPAYTAGLQPGDVLLAADNQSLLALPLPAVDAAISDQVGHTITFKVHRKKGSQLLTINVTVAP